MLPLKLETQGMINQAGGSMKRKFNPGRSAVKESEHKVAAEKHQRTQVTIESCIQQQNLSIDREGTLRQAGPNLCKLYRY